MRKLMWGLLASATVLGCSSERSEPAAQQPAINAAAAAVPGEGPGERPPPGVSVSGKPLAPLVIAEDQHALLHSDDPKLARNKKHVYDFWRIVYEAGHMERAAEFMAPEYIQHNPNVESGRDAFIATMSVARPKREVSETSRFPIIAGTSTFSSAVSSGRR